MTYSDMKNRMQSNGNINLKWSPGENTCVCSNSKLNRKFLHLWSKYSCVVDFKKKKKKQKTALVYKLDSTPVSHGCDPG